jgi:hypothetical protein
VSSITIISDAPNCGFTYDRNSFIIQATGRRYLQSWPEELDAFRRPNSPHRPLEEPHESLAVALHGADQDHHLQIISVELCETGNTKGGSITVPLTSGLTGLESAV